MRKDLPQPLGKELRTTGLGGVEDGRLDALAQCFACVEKVRQLKFTQILLQPIYLTKEVRGELDRLGDLLEAQLSGRASNGVPTTSRSIERTVLPDVGLPGRVLVLVGGLQLVVEHFLVEDGRQRAADGRDDPHPVGGTAPAKAVFILQVLHEGLGGGVVVHYGHIGALVAVEDGGCDLHRSSVLPQGRIGGGVQAHVGGHQGEDVVAVGVAEVPHRHLGVHVPAAEGAGGEFDAADVEFHRADCGQGVPLQL